MAEAVDDDFGFGIGIVAELGAVAVGVHDCGEAAGIVVFIAGQRHAAGVFHGGDVVGEVGVVVMVFGGEVGAGIAVGETQDLEEVAGITVIDVADGWIRG